MCRKVGQTEVISPTNVKIFRESHALIIEMGNLLKINVVSNYLNV